MNDLTGAVARTRARLAHGDSCHEHVMRGGRGEPCDKPAVALRDDTEADSYYPVCVRHARGFCIPVVDRFDLLALLDALDAAEAQVQRVRALHFGEYVDYGPRLRRTCSSEYVEDEDLNRCYECGDDWPCATIRSIDDVMCPTCGEPHPCSTIRAINEEVTL